MVKKFLLISTFLIAILFIVAYSLFYFKPTNSITFNTSNLKNGDLILRCGKSTESFAVYTADKNAEFTHIGLIVFENTKPFVIHAVPHKNHVLKKETIQEFLKPKNASKYAIYRSNLSPEKQHLITSEALNFFNKKIIFDNHYNLDTNNEMYCTELILKTYKKANIQLDLKTKELNFLVGKHQIIFPSEFTKFPFKKVNIN
ncbi:YiiX/YebB-like N1pC/P60 family cysteine hydrolase [Lutibacter sp. TH_r2]|uniref:YiiX/YebB-like N1pC/P60 family cysteine hydrolase n=1 Tax=Lutibacter sp. TH_r2 TaxID=3082083 RepID=UPI002952F0E5|nr:YiiX/YebB-like N1pC/P60 family cysteine hydrolase [Lutibacter sp. TH_r2]MDV7185687.1 YiiX/YebB-like N1pC/P60 family cysteine hydrolase [Lutibacter sp. TH_r2]